MLFRLISVLLLVMLSTPALASSCHDTPAPKQEHAVHHPATTDHGQTLPDDKNAADCAVTLCIGCIAPLHRLAAHGIARPPARAARPAPLRGASALIGMRAVPDTPPPRMSV